VSSNRTLSVKGDGNNCWSRGLVRTGEGVMEMKCRGRTGEEEEQLVVLAVSGSSNFKRLWFGGLG